MMRVLLLGGTTEAREMADRLAREGVPAIYSYAGRTQAPVMPPLPTRVGGFGGTEGLMDYLRTDGISHVVDATHPFAERMSRNAFDACAQVGLPLIRLERPPWVPGPGDRWTSFSRLEDVPAALPSEPARVFLAIGKQQLGLFAARPQHHYVLRLVDPPGAGLPLPDAEVVLARGPFDVDGDLALMRVHRITHIVAKNSGGRGAQAKLEAARQLGLPVLMAARPRLPGDRVAADADTVMHWLGHEAERGV